MADRPSMKDGLSELFRRTDSGGAPAERDAQEAVVKGRPYITTIKVVGIGGAGTNAINRMVDSGVKGVEFIAVNTDVQQLDVCDADVKIHIGQEITHGLGGGADPDVGREAMEVSRDQLKAALRGADLVFVTAGEGVYQAAAGLFPFSPDHEVDPLGLRGSTDFFMHQGGMVAADHDLDLGPELLEQMGNLDTGIELPGHGRKADQVGLDLVDHPGQIFFYGPALADQVDQIDLVILVDIATNRGNAVVGHVECGLMDDDRHHIGHGYQDNFHDGVTP